MKPPVNADCSTFLDNLNHHVILQQCVSDGGCILLAARPKEHTLWDETMTTQLHSDCNEVSGLDAQAILSDPTSELATIERSMSLVENVYTIFVLDR